MPVQPAVPIGTGSAKGDPPTVQVDPKAAKKPEPAIASPAPPPAKGDKPKEIDAKELDPEEARKRCAAIYKREKKVEAKRKLHEVAKKGAKAAKAALDDAEDALEKEIREQRFGPGPLFSPDGQSPA